MYTFRFNPVFQQWVLLGEPVPHAVTIAPAHLLGLRPRDRRARFVAAHYPRTPFVLSPSDHKVSGEAELAYVPQPPVGEYELLLYRGERDLFTWRPAEWEQWLLLLLDRLNQLQLNPYLHFVTVRFATGARHTVEGYERVGDLIATSHPLEGMGQPLTRELVQKITTKERLFVIDHDAGGTLYVPSAPLHGREIWYLPTGSSSTIATLEEARRHELAEVLSALFTVLGRELPDRHFILSIHTDFSGTTNEHTWWVQLHEEDQSANEVLPMHFPPERFAYLMHQLLAHYRASK